MNARPRGRRNPVLEVPLPPECQEMIRRGALVSISTSGGKDSQAMTILLARIVPHDQLVAVHAPLAEVDWSGTIPHIQTTLPEGVPLILAPVASEKPSSNASKNAASGLRVRFGGAPRILRLRRSSANSAVI